MIAFFEVLVKLDWLSYQIIKWLDWMYCHHDPPYTGPLQVCRVFCRAVLLLHQFTAKCDFWLALNTSNLQCCVRISVCLRLCKFGFYMASGGLSGLYFALGIILTINSLFGLFMILVTWYWRLNTEFVPSTVLVFPHPQAKQNIYVRCTLCGLCCVHLLP